MIVCGLGLGMKKKSTSFVIDMALHWSNFDTVKARDFVKKADLLVNPDQNNPRLRHIPSPLTEACYQGLRAFEAKTAFYKNEGRYESIEDDYGVDEDEKYSSHYDSGVSLSASSVTSLSMDSEVGQEWMSRASNLSNCRAQSFIEELFHRALQSEEDDAFGSGFEEPASDDNVLGAAVTEFKKWAAESHIRPQSTTSKLTSPSPLSPAVSSPVSKVKSSKLPMTPLSPATPWAGMGAGAGVFAGFDDDDSDDEDDGKNKKLKQLLLMNRQNSNGPFSTPPPRMASAGARFRSLRKRKSF
ncbi:hypothetical protein BC829DRAFT_459118, partial [Chytridium lagenaria]